jgi:hypothetical protein
MLLEFGQSATQQTDHLQEEAPDRVYDHFVKFFAG